MASTSTSVPFVAPVITEALLSEIKQEFKVVEDVPDCTALKTYFIERIRHGSYQKVNFLLKEYAELCALFPMLEGVDDDVYPLFDYYIEHYPAYSTLTDRLGIYTGVDDESMKQVFNHWFKEFYCYLRVKIKSIPMMIRMTSKKDSSTMTVAGKHCVSNICINISGPSINNLVFNKQGDDVIIRYSELPALTSVDTYPEYYMHLPHMLVDFTIPYIISFSRSLELKYDRFLALRSTPQILKKSNEIKSSKKIQPHSVTSYTYSFIEAFFKKLTSLLQTSTNISASRQHEMLLVVNEFLTDIKELKFYSSSCSKFVFGSNLEVTYLIGGKMYDRPHKNNGANLKLLEALSPLVTIALKEFYPCHQRGTEGTTTFTTLERLAENTQEFDRLELHNVLKYTCLKCSVFETDYARILDHYKKEHPIDLPVICSNCKQEVPITVLASRRWKHSCRK